MGAALLVVVLTVSLSFRTKPAEVRVVEETPLQAEATVQEAQVGPSLAKPVTTERKPSAPPPPADINELLKQGKTELAIERFKEILANDPSNEMALMALANLYFKNPETRGEAEGLYKKALDTNSENREALEKYLDLQAKPGQLGGPLQRLESLVKENPESPNISGAYARTLANKGQFAEAQATMERAIQSPDVNATAIATLVDLAAKNGDYAGAARAIEQSAGKQEANIADRIRKNLPTADQERALAMTQAHLVTQYINLSQIDKAEATIAAIASKNPNHPALKSLRADLDRKKRT